MSVLPGYMYVLTGLTVSDGTKMEEPRSTMEDPVRRASPSSSYLGLEAKMKVKQKMHQAANSL